VRDEKYRKEDIVSLKIYLLFVTGINQRAE